MGVILPLFNHWNKWRSPEYKNFNHSAFVIFYIGGVEELEASELTVI